MTPRVREMLAWYQGDTPGVLKNLATVLNHGPIGGTGKVLTMTVDRGIENGPVEAFAYNPDSFSPHYYFQTASRIGLNALVAPLGVLESNVRDFIGEVPLVLKLDHLVTLSNYHSSIKTAEVERALELGCVGVAFTLPIGAENFESFVEKISYEINLAKKSGLLVFISVVRAGQDGDEIKKISLPLNQAAFGTHLACQLGAHIIHIAPVAKPTNELRDFYDQNRIRFEKSKHRKSHVLTSAFNKERIVLGSFKHEASSVDNTDDLLEWIEAGASGIDLGEHGFIHPQAIVEKEITKYHNIIRG